MLQLPPQILVASSDGATRRILQGFSYMPLWTQLRPSKIPAQQRLNVGNSLDQVDTQRTPQPAMQQWPWVSAYPAELLTSAAADPLSIPSGQGNGYSLVDWGMCYACR